MDMKILTKFQFVVHRIHTNSFMYTFDNIIKVSVYHKGIHIS